MSVTTLSTQRLFAIGALALLVTSGQLKAQVKSVNGVTIVNVKTPSTPVDFVHAKPMPLPINPSETNATEGMMRALESVPSAGPSAFSPGAPGSGKTSPVSLGKPEIAIENSQGIGVTPDDFGTNNHPFSTARADLYSENTNTTYPYRAAGKLFFNEAGGSYVCSASMIKRGVVVTAAHCVANYGQSQFYSGWQFVPAYHDGSAPYGVWTVARASVLTAYYNGTDSCATYGVVCPDDVAILVLNPQNGAYAGATTGWFGYWYGGGFTSNGLVQITQLGYPVGLDNGYYMERNDSQGYKSSSNSNNTIIGSNMNGGSSGGPWIANFGLPYALTGETNGSGYSFTNAIVGVTSWGYTASGPKEQGAAPFTSGNIQSLLSGACSATPAACS